jgi:hypothetical protein
MIHYIVAAGPPHAIDRMAPRLLPAVEGTRYFEGTSIERRATSGTWAAAAIDLPDPLCPVRIVGTGDDLLVVNGPALTTRGDQANLAAGALAAYVSGGSDGLAASLSGGYDAVAVTSAQGLRAFTDFTGMSPMYWHQGSDVALFSNRTSTIAAATGRAAWDVQALAWVLGTGTLHGEDMPASGVRHLPPGREGRVPWGGSDITVDGGPVWVWPEPGEMPLREDLDPAEWDEVTDELVANFRVLGSLTVPVRLYLSGGKDSRLCLALSKAAGLDNVMEARTNGADTSPEVQCAAAVADAVGFRHVQVAPSEGSVPDPDVVWQKWWDRLHRHVYRFDAIVSPWDGLTDPIRSMSLNVKGTAGELYRRGIKRMAQRQGRTTADLATIYATGADPLGILRRPEAELQAAWRAEWFERAARDVHFEALPERWYVDFRMSHWNGPLAACHGGYLSLVPLLAPDTARKNMELVPKARSSDRFHFEVIRRAAPELLGIPFLGDVWDDSVVARSTVELPAEPWPTAVEPTRKVLARPKWDFLAHERKRIDRVFADANRQTELGDICDVRKLRWKLRRSEKLLPPGAKQIFSALGVSLALLGRAEPAIDVIPPPG